MELKKTTTLLLIILSTTLNSIAQSINNEEYNYVNPDVSQPVPERNNALSLGFGVGGYYPYSGTMYVENPNITLSYENKTFKHIGPGYISLGELFSYKNIYSGYTDYTTNYDYVQHWNYYIFGSRIAYHLAPLTSENIEPYAGAMVGYYLTSYKFTSTDPNSFNPSDPGYYLTKSDHFPNFFALSMYAGIRSWFNKHEAIWLEVGYGYTSFSFGLSYKM